MSEQRKFINPMHIKEKDLPLIVFLDNRRSFFSWGVKAHSKGNYSHVMIMHRKGFFATQGMLGYKEVSVEKYMKPAIMLKFWQSTTISDKERKEFSEAVKKELKNLPWYRRIYDFVGIFGQMIRIQSINIPWLDYCTERVIPYIHDFFKINTPLHPTPSEVNEIFKKYIVAMKILGYWWDD